MQNAQLIDALDRLDEQWTTMSPARIRSLLQNDGLVVSEKRAKALKAQVVRSRAATDVTSGTSPQHAVPRTPASPQQATDNRVISASPQHATDSAGTSSPPQQGTTPPGASTCASCGAPAATCCSVCTVVNYCSKSCQRAHWKQHRRSCAPKSTPLAECDLYLGRCKS